MQFTAKKHLEFLTKMEKADNKCWNLQSSLYFEKNESPFSLGYTNKKITVIIKTTGTGAGRYQTWRRRIND